MQQVTSIANQAVFDLPWLVARQEGLFAQEDIEVVFLPQIPWDARRPPETDPGHIPPFWQYTRFETREAAAFMPASGGRCGARRPVALGAGLSRCGRPSCPRPLSSV